MGPIARRLVVGAAALVALVCAAAGEDRRTDPTRLVVVTSNAEFLEGRRYRTSLVGGRDTYAEQEVCLLTRIDPEGGAIARDDREGCSDSVRKSVSKDDVARIRVGSLELGLVGARLHAEPNREDRRAQREAQADAVRGTARDLRAAGCVPVVLGDFNDHDGVDDARGCVDSTPITNVLVSIRAVDLATPANVLWNAAALVPTPLRCTPFWDQDDDGQIDAPRALTSINPVLLSSEVRPMVEVVEFPHSHDPRRVTDRFSSVVRLRIGEAAPATSSTTTVRIVRLPPNSGGDETQDEEAAIRNTASTAASLVGWRLRDLAGKTWSLDGLGTLASGEKETNRRADQPMAINNGGDTVGLLDCTRTVVHSVTYENVGENEEVRVAL